MAHDWISETQISQFKGLHRVFTSAADFDFGWWFAYFWKEAKAAGWKLDNSGEKLKDLFVTIYGDPTVGVSGYRNKQQAAVGIVIRGDNAWPPTDAAKRLVLNLALEIGFKAMSPTAADGGVTRGNEVRRYFKNKIRLRSGGNGRRALPVGCRGDGRDFDKVKEHGGALNRVDLGINNMGAAWHPFSAPPQKNQLFFRASSGDNCLYSVLSVAESMRLAVGFPLIEDEQIFRFPSKSLLMHYKRDDVQAANAGSVKLARCTCRIAGKLRTGVFLATETYAYSFKVMGDAVHTQDFLESEMSGAKDQCLERGVREVALQDFLFGLKLRRVHHGPTRGHGITAFIQDVRYQMGGDWYPAVGAKDFAHHHFDDDSQAADAVLQPVSAQVAHGTIEGERIGSPGPKIDIVSIDQWDLSYDDFTKLMAEPRNKHHGDNLFFASLT